MSESSFSDLDVFRFTVPLADVFQNLELTSGSLPARRALAAGLVLHEVHEKPGHVDHAGVFVHHDGAAGSHNGTDFHDGLEIDGRVEILLRYTAARRTAQLYRLEFFLFGYAAADIVDNLSQGRSHGHFNQSDVVHVAREGEDLGALCWSLYRRWHTMPRPGA